MKTESAASLLTFLRGSVATEEQLLELGHYASERTIGPVLDSFVRDGLVKRKTVLLRRVPLSCEFDSESGELFDANALERILRPRWKNAPLVSATVYHVRPVHPEQISHDVCVTDIRLALQRSNPEWTWLPANPGARGAVQLDATLLDSSGRTVLALDYVAGYRAPRLTLLYSARPSGVPVRFY